MFPGEGIDILFEYNSLFANGMPELMNTDIELWHTH